MGVVTVFQVVEMTFSILFDLGLLRGGRCRIEFCGDDILDGEALSGSLVFVQVFKPLHTPVDLWRNLGVLEDSDVRLPWLQLLASFDIERL